MSEDTSRSSAPRTGAAATDLPRRPAHASALALLVAASLAAPPASAAPASAAPATDAPAAAEAAPALPRLAVLPPALVGSDDPLIRDQLAAELRNGLARGRLELLDPGAVAGRAKDPCDAACVRRLHAELGADFVFRSEVSVSDRDYTLRLELVTARSGETAAASEQVCELCGLAELRALAADQSARLLARLEALARPPPALDLVTQPPGALVFVDGQLVGQAPLQRNLLEGDHVVRVTLEGHVAEERRVSAVAGLTEHLTLSLRRAPETLKLRGAAWGMLASGITLTLVGTGLLSADGDPYQGRCEGQDIDLEGDCRFVLDTAWGGAVLFAAGAGLITASAMLLRRTRDRARDRRNRVRAAIGPTGVSVSGRF